MQTVAEIDSTNVWMTQQAQSGALEGLVLRAEHQTRGRGRRDRVWEAPPQSSLLCSILLRPALGLDQAQNVVCAVALSARAAVLELTGRAPAIKWPNDLLFDGKKLAGILTELVMTPTGPAVVVGIGMNCTAANPEISTATSLRDATGHDVAPDTVLTALLEQLTLRRPLLDTPDGLALLRVEYREHLDTLGRDVRVELVGETVHGRAVDVDETGQILVEVGGRVQAFGVGDIVHLRPEERT